MQSKTRQAFEAGWHAGRHSDEALEEHWTEFEIMQANRPTWKELAERLLILLSILFLMFYVFAPLIGWAIKLGGR